MFAILSGANNKWIQTLLAADILSNGTEVREVPWLQASLAVLKDQKGPDISYFNCLRIRQNRDIMKPQNLIIQLNHHDTTV